MSEAESRKRKAAVKNAGLDKADLGEKKAKKKKKIHETNGSEIDNSLEKTGDATSPRPEKTHKYSAEEAAAWKKRKKFFQKKRMQQPKFFLLEGKPKENGEPNTDKESSDDGRARIIKRREPVSLNEVLYLLEYGLLGNHASFRPSWCKLLRVAKVTKVILIVLNGVTSRAYRRKRHCFPNIASRSVSAKIFPAPSYFAMLQDVLSHNKSRTRLSLHNFRAIRAAARVNAQASKQQGAGDGQVERGGGEGSEGPPPLGRTHYLVSKEDWAAGGYPARDDEGCVHTRHSESASESSPLFGIDCEMVLTSAGSELARVSLVDESGKVLYNSFVKPHNPIRDYLTEYSGMTKALLDPVSTRLADAQQAVIDALPADAILVGQGPENDLGALKLYHPHCVDTSSMFTGSTRRVKLKLLAKEYLGRDIQCGSAGHDSVEDATAALDLFKLKLRLGDKLRNYFQDNTKQSVFQARESIFQLAQELQKKACAVDTRSTLKKFRKEPVSCIACSNDAEICKKACSALAGSDFVCMQLHGYNNLLQGDTIQDQDVEATLSLLDERVGVVLAALPPNTLHVTLMPGCVRLRASPHGGQGDLRVRHGRCVVGLKVDTIQYPQDR